MKITAAFNVYGSNLNELEADLKKKLEVLAPGRRWSWSMDVVPHQASMLGVTEWLGRVAAEFKEAL